MKRVHTFSQAKSQAKKQVVELVSREFSFMGVELMQHGIQIG